MNFLYSLLMLISLLGFSLSQFVPFDNSKDYDYLMLELTWPVTFCYRQRCSKIPRIFTIHGNWPNRFDRRLVNYCEDYTNGNENIEQETSEFQSRLSEVWPALKRGDDLDFWNYQWKKHGRCAIQTSPLRGMKNFFLGTLNLYEDLKLDRVLTNLGYVPRNLAYNSNQLFHDLKTHYGVSPNIKCMNNLPGKVSFLKNISFCFHKTTLELINCNGSINCKRDLIIPDNL